MPLTVVDRVRFAWHDFRNLVRRVYESGAEANVPFLASGLTFDALLAAVPLAFLALALVGYILSAGADRAQLEVTDYVRRFLPATSGERNPFDQALRIIEGVVQQRGTFGVFGVPLFIWFSTRLFGSLRACLCELFDIEESRSWVRGKLVDIALVLVTGFLVVLNTVASQGVALLADGGGVFGFLAIFGAQLLAFVFVLALFVIIFRYAPARKLRRDTAVVAGLICAVAFEAAKPVLTKAFSVWIHPDRFVTDSTLSAILVFVIWTYYMATIFLIGGAIGQVYELRRRQAAQRLLLG